MQIVLSSSLAPVPAPPREILDSWKQRRRALEVALATDPRLPAPVQRNLIGLAATAGVGVVEVAHPLLAEHGGTPRLASDDRDERRAAAAALRGTVRLAASTGVGRVVLHPPTVELQLSAAELQRRFARGEPWDGEALREERQARLPAALDALRSVLDAALEEAAPAGATLCFLLPTIWPHQLPNATELCRLQREFAGAPLDAVGAADWHHAAVRVLEHQPSDDPAPPPAEAPAAAGPLLTSAEALLATDLAPSRSPSVVPLPARVAALRIADAAGLTLRLPLGCGELARPGPWRELLGDDGDAVLTLENDVTPIEVEQSVTETQTLLGGPG